MSNASLGQQSDFRSLINHLDGVALWTASEPGKLDFMSSGFEAIWGIPPDEVKDDLSKLIETVHPDDRELVRSVIQQTESEVSTERFEHRVVQPDGTVRWVRATIVPIRDVGGSLQEMVGISVDTTEQKQLEIEYEALNRVLRHDIRNDMTVVLGWVEVLEEHTTADGDEILEKILTAGEHIVELTEIARDYSESITGNDMNLEPVSLRETLFNEVEIRRETFSHATFTVGEFDDDIDVAANSLLSSVFRNLLNNAVQHNDKDDPVVEISAETRDEMVVVRVADNGPGIPDSQKEAVFGKEQKGIDSSGTGMGLYLVRTLVEQYGGRVWIEDNDPTGTVINIELWRE